MDHYRSSAASTLTHTEAGGVSFSSMCSADALHIQQKLDETTKLLRDLQEAQKERLSAKQPPNMICLLAPSTKELELGEDLGREINQSINQ